MSFMQRAIGLLPIHSYVVPAKPKSPLSVVLKKKKNLNYILYCTNIPKKMLPLQLVII